MRLRLIKLHTLVSVVCPEKGKYVGQRITHSGRNLYFSYLGFVIYFCTIKYVNGSYASKRNVVMYKKFKVFATRSAKIEALLCCAAFFKNHFSESIGEQNHKAGKPIVNLR